MGVYPRRRRLSQLRPRSSDPAPGGWGVSGLGQPKAPRQHKSSPPRGNFTCAALSTDLPPSARLWETFRRGGERDGAGAAALSQRGPRGRLVPPPGPSGGSAATSLPAAGQRWLRGGGAAVGPRRGGRKTLRLAGGAEKRRRRCPPGGGGQGALQAHRCRGSRLGDRGESATPRLRGCSCPPPRSAFYESGGGGKEGRKGVMVEKRKQAFATAPGIPATSSGMEQPNPSQPCRPPFPSSPPPATASTSREGSAQETGGLGTAPGSGACSLSLRPPAFRSLLAHPALAVRADAPRHQEENLRQNHFRHLLIPTPDRRASASKSMYLLVLPYPQMPPVGLFPERINVSATTHLNSA